MGDSKTPLDGLSLGECLKIAKIASRLAGKKIVEMLYSAEVREKSSKDLVTDADIAAQAVIFDALLSHFPSHQFVGEEGLPSASSQSGEHPQVVSSEIPPDCWCWVVDPIDGTANYVHRFPNFAVSVALVRDGISYVGVVYDPMADELYSAVVGEGAQLNGEPIQASGCESLEKALIAASFPPNVQRGSVEIQQFVEVLVEAQSVRRLGSAALNLCYVACGRLDGYWAGKVRSWDVAAGVLIAAEAHCKLTRMNGQAFELDRGDLIVAASTALHTELSACLNSVL
jgi:myo-inositol-1(or 4)-monophosphatase